MNFFENRLAERGQHLGFGFAGRKIRVGTKAITKSATEAGKNNPAVRNVLDQLAKRQISFKQAEKAMADAGFTGHAFYPRNTREFHAHPWDMGAGAEHVSQKLMELYGQQLPGDTAPKLYRFPVVFPEVGGDIGAIIDGKLQVSGGGPNTTRFWSEFNSDGVRVCKHLPAIVKHEQAQRRQNVRAPERQAVTRGPCVPENCQEFSSGMCKFNGTVNFYIPGIAGAGVFKLHTGSTQAATEMYLHLTEAIRMLNGRMQNYTPDGEPVFWITKIQAERSYLDPDTQQMRRGLQWVPTLEMNIELPKVLWLKQSGQLSSLQAPEGSQQSLAGPVVDDVRQPQAAVPTAWLQDGGDTKPTTQRPERVQAAAVHQRATVVTPVVATAHEAQAAAQPISAQGDVATQSSVDFVTVMTAHAREKGYEAQLNAWVAFRFGGDQASAAAMWKQFTDRIGDKVIDLIALYNELNDCQVSIDAGMTYMKLKFGPVGSGARIGVMREHLVQLLRDGPAVVKQVIEDTAASAAA
jgi:hypothetical protein